jgi:hypothetical protein
MTVRALLSRENEHFSWRTYMTNVNTNGQRKTLASQLDRLDTILDTLDQGLQEAVASAVQEAVSVAVREAIKGLVTEVLTNPDLLAQIRALLIVKNTPKPTGNGEKLHAVVKERFGRWWSSIRDRVQTTKQACRIVRRRIAQWTCKLLSHVRVLGLFKRQLLLSCGVGLMAGVGAYVAGPYVAAAVGWVGGFATTVSVQAALAWEKLKAVSKPDS